MLNKMNVENLINLKEDMRLLDESQELLQRKKKRFEEDNIIFIERIKELNERINRYKFIARENAEVGYAKDGVKRRLGGIGIRVSNKLYYDESVALAWAKEKDLCLQLDKKGFEGFAKTGNFDFVEITEEVGVTFPKEIILEEEE